VLGDSPGIGLSIDEAAMRPITERSVGPARHGPHVRPANAGSRLDNELPR